MAHLVKRRKAEDARGADFLDAGGAVFFQQTGTIMGLSGWVRNVGADGVETVAEGERATLEEFVQAVKTGPRASHVDEARVEWETVTGEFRWFDVKPSI